MQIKKTFLLVLVLLLVSIPLLATEDDLVTDEITAESAEMEDKVVAEVDGEEIKLSELESEANVQQLVMQVSQIDEGFAQVLFSTEEGQVILEEYQEMKLDEIINEMLLRKEAEKHDITVSNSEVDQMFEEHIEMVKEENDLTEDELLDVLSQQGIETLDDYKELVIDEDNLVVEKFMEKEVLDNVDIDDPENNTEVQETLSEYLEDLREDADVSINL